MGGTSIIGNFRGRDLAVKGGQFLSLDLSNSTFSGPGLKGIFPNMSIPEEFNRAGLIHFAGKFDGYPNNFVAYGTFTTSLGKVTLDMSLNTVEGIAKGKYSGRIGFEDFDIGTLTGIKDLGRITMSGRVIEGRGLTTKNLYADLSGSLKH